MSAQNFKAIKKNKVIGECVWLLGFNKKVEMIILIFIFTLMNLQMKIILVVNHFPLWIEIVATGLLSNILEI